ncbi:MAG: hypothetical protein KTM48_02740, partial [Wolbachia endosymbiont of Pissodes strobi]|nr:hypothetical protein [Wolbachia endosymbiont of Pissodes strobi]
MKILQVNADRSQPAHDAAFLTASEEDIDIIVASEPNLRTIRGNGWFSDTRRDVAVYFVNRNIKVRKIDKADGIVCIKHENFAIYGCYVSPNIHIIDFENYVDALVGLVESEGGKAVVLGGENGAPPLKIAGARFSQKERQV